MERIKLDEFQKQQLMIVLELFQKFKFKYFLFLLVVLLKTNNGFAIIYYVSNSIGNDNNNGTSQATPWKTLSKVNSMMSTYVGGDQILFRKGEEWYGTLTISKSGTSANRIVFGAYGSGATNPTLSGFSSLTSWTTVPGYPNVYKCSVPVTLSAINVFTINGLNKGCGRWPNFNETTGGYRNISNGTADGSLVKDAALSPPFVNYVGGDVVINNRFWMLNKNRISSQSSFNSGIQYHVTPTLRSPGVPWGNVFQHGYFIQNHINTLDLDGEWCFNQSENAVYLYSSINPITLDVKVSTLASVITTTSNNISNFTIENLVVKGANDRGFNLGLGGTCDNITIQNCEIMQCYNGIRTFFCSNSLFTSNNIHDNSNNGFNIDGNNNVIENNTFNNIAIIPGMGNSGSVQCFGILAGAQNTNGTIIIRNNFLNNIGYVGIVAGGPKFLIEKNVVSNCGLTQADGGPIYINNPNTTGQSVNDRKIINNILFNNFGTYFNNGYKKGHFYGIYLDVVSSFITVENNTIFDSHAGLKLNDRANNNIMRNNLIYDCTDEGFNAYLDYNTSEGPLLFTNFLNTFSNNTLYLGDNATQIYYYLRKSNGIDGINKIGAINNNYFFAPKNQAFPFETNEIVPNQLLTLNFNQFKQRYTHDQNSYFCPIKYATNQSLANNTYFFYNTQNTTQNFSIPTGIYINRYGESVCLNSATGVNLEPFTSDIFTKVTEVTTDTTTEAVEVSTNAGWTYYAPASNPTNILFAIEKTPAITNGNTATFDASVFVTTNGCITTFPNHIKTQSTEATLSGRNFCNFKINSTTKPNGLVNIRWFLSPQDLVDLNNSATDFSNANSFGTISPTLFLKKKNSKMQLPTNLRDDGIGITYAFDNLVLSSQDEYNGKNYYQFNNVSNIHNTGVGVFKRVSNLPTDSSQYNITTTPPEIKGSLRFNPLTNTFEGFDGVKWEPLH